MKSPFEITVPCKQKDSAWNIAWWRRRRCGSHVGTVSSCVGDTCSSVLADSHYSVNRCPLVIVFRAKQQNVLTPQICMKALFSWISSCLSTLHWCLGCSLLERLRSFFQLRYPASLCSAISNAFHGRLEIYPSLQLYNGSRWPSGYIYFFLRVSKAEQPQKERSFAALTDGFLSIFMLFFFFDILARLHLSNKEGNWSENIINVPVITFLWNVSTHRRILPNF